MSTHQSIPHVVPRVRNALGTVLTVLGALIAIAVTIIMLSLDSTKHATVPNPVTASQAASGSVPHYDCLGAAQRCRW